MAITEQTRERLRLIKLLTVQIFDIVVNRFMKKKNTIFIVILFLVLLAVFLIIMLKIKNIPLSNIMGLTYKSPIVKRHANARQDEYIIVLKSKSEPDYSPCAEISDWDSRGECVYKKVIQAATEQKNQNAEIFQYLSNQPIEYKYFEVSNDQIFLIGVEDEKIVEEIYDMFKDKIDYIREASSLTTM